MKHLDSHLVDKLKSLAGSEDAFEELKEIFGQLVEERDQYKQYLTLLESAIRYDYDSILITDLKLEDPGPQIVYVNPGFEKMTGYKREEVIGETPRILHGPKTDRETLDRLKQQLKEGRSFFGYTVNYRKDGSEFVNQWDIHPLMDGEGNITHWVSYQHDITERKRAEEAFLEREVETDDLYESSKRTIFDVNPKGEIVYANKAFRELIGYDKQELLSANLFELISSQEQKGVLQEEFSKIQQEPSKAGKCYRVKLTRKNNSPVHVELLFKAMSSEDETVLRLEVTNISLRQKVLKALERHSSEFSSLQSEKDVDFYYSLELENGQPGFKWLSEDVSKLIGYEPDECKGHEGWRKIVHPEDQPRVLEHLEKVISGVSACENYRLVTRAGTPVSVADYSKLSEEKPGQIRGAVTSAIKETSSEK